LNRDIKTDLVNRSVMRLLFGFAFVLGVSRNAVGPLTPVFAEEFNIGYDTMGFIFFLGVFCGMISIVVLGRLSDRIGRKSILVISLILTLSGITGIIFSNSVVSFIISYCVMSSGFAGIEAGVTLGAADVSRGKKSAALNSVFKFDSLGAFIAPSIIFAIIFLQQTWKIFFIVILTLAVIIFIILLRLRYPKAVSVMERPRLKVRDVLNPLIILGSTVLIFSNGVIVQFAVWFTTYFLEFGINVEYSSLVVSLYWLSMLIGRLIIQRLLNRFEERKILFFITFIAMVALFIIAFTGNIWVKVVFSFFLGLAVSGVYPILFSIILTPNSRIMGGIYSFLGFVGYSTIMLYQLLIGYIAENFGKGYIIFVQLGSGVLVFIFTIFLIRTSVRAESK
jgi:MFS family permease